jgi:hypothetical protein
MRLLLRIPIIRAVSVLFIFSLFGCQTENIEEPNPIVLVNEAVKYVERKELLSSEKGVVISYIETELTKPKSFCTKINSTYSRLPNIEALMRNMRNHLTFKVIDSKTMEFSFNDQFGKYEVYKLKYSPKKNSFDISLSTDADKFNKSLKERSNIYVSYSSIK